MRRFFSLSIVLIFILPIFTVLPFAKAQELSEIGTRAFDDLTRCINTKAVLNVYYLVDESNSLPRTDPQKSRAEILATSLEALGSFGTDVRVSYGIGFFGSDFRQWRDWREVNPTTIEREASEFAAEVRVRDKSNETNWYLGVVGAADQIAKQQEAVPGCAALIWLTDGGLWIQRDGGSANQIDQSRVDEAREVLCNETFPRLRELNVSVFGVLLKNETALKELKRSNPTYYQQNSAGMDVMRQLVEGEGDLEGNPTPGRCGDPLKDSESAGALLIAEDPVTLALQFLILNGTTQGGKQVGLAPGNPTNFEIEKGVRRAQLITTSKGWTLTDPNGVEYSNGSPILNVENSNGVQLIDILGKPLVIGEWTFEFDRGVAVTNKLILFSGLAIKLDPNQLMAGYKGIISGRLVVESGTGKVNMRDYRPTRLEAKQIEPGGKSENLRGGVLNDDGSFEIEINPSGASDKVELRITVRLFTQSGSELAPVSISKFLDIFIPSNYPTFEPSIKLSTLKGPSGEAKGTLLVRGPKTGNGKICFANSPNYAVQISEDPLTPNRTSTYSWNISQLNSSKCVELAKGSERTLEILVKNSTAKDAKIKATLPLKLLSDAQPGQELSYQTQISFDSELKRVGAPAIKVLLFLLGIFLPFLFLYLLNRATHKLALGNGIQRAEFPVVVDSMRGILDRKGNPLQVKPDDFSFISQIPDDVQYKDRIGTFRALVSPIPLSEPWAEVTANSGTRIQTMYQGPARLRERFLSGQISAVRPDVGLFWGLVYEEKDLENKLNESSVPAKLVIFKRHQIRNLEQHTQRVLEATSTPGIWNRLSEIRKAPKVAIVNIDSVEISDKSDDGPKAPPPPVIPPQPPNALPQGVSTPPPPPVAPPPPIAPGPTK